jgi:ribosomal protein S18 acetylase RimI-like enzyme
MLDCVIRTAEPSDLDRIAVLCAEHAAFERTPQPVSVDTKQLAQVLFEDPPMLRALVAADEAGVVAYATYTFDFATWRLAPYLHIDCLFVAAAYRGRGLGRRLMHALAGVARERSCETIEWQTPAWNRPAVAFTRGSARTDRQRCRGE